jgi:hypothetical protein
MKTGVFGLMRRVKEACKSDLDSGDFRFEGRVLEREVLSLGC